MELGVQNGTATLTSFVDGNASIYFSSGGGIIGGFAHQNVHNAAVQFVTEATKFLNVMSRVNDFPLPIIGNISFYALTDKGVLTITANEKQLQDKKAAIWPLYYLGQNVITQLRTISPG